MPYIFKNNNKLFSMSNATPGTKSSITLKTDQADAPTEAKMR